MARTIPAAHAVNAAVEYQPAQAIYTTPLWVTAGNANFLFANWSPNYSVQCLDANSNTYITETGAAGYTERVVFRIPVQAGRGNVRVRARLKCDDVPTGAAAVCQVRTSSGTSTISLPATAAAQTFAWYESSDQAYDTTGTHDYVSVALKADVNVSGHVYLASVELYYAKAASLGAGVLAGTFRAQDTTAWQADEALSVKRARDLDNALLHVHTAMLWPIAAFTDALADSKGVWKSDVATTRVRVLGPVYIPRNMGGGVVDEIGFSALVVGPAGGDRARIYTTNSPYDDAGDPAMLDSHSWTPALTGFAGTEWRTAGNWEDHVLKVNPDAPTYLFLDLSGTGGGGGARSYLYSLTLWATAR